MDKNESQELAEALARAEKAERELAEYKAQAEGDHDRPRSTREIFAEWMREHVTEFEN